MAGEEHSIDVKDLAKGIVIMNKVNPAEGFMPLEGRSLTFDEGRYRALSTEHPYLHLPKAYEDEEEERKSESPKSYCMSHLL